MSEQPDVILVVGSEGMLGRDLAPRLAKLGCQVVRTDLHQTNSEAATIVLDITDPEQCSQIVGDLAPTWIVNCAAYTGVDAAEKEYETALSVNTYGPANLARAALRTEARLVQISSDYVFGNVALGSRGRIPFSEEEATAPCGVYGHSKNLADQLVAMLMPDHHLVVRTSWLHGIHGPNFIDTMLKLGSDRDELKVVNDQIGSPTWTVWLADMIARLIEKQASGVFHASSNGGISWYDLAIEVFHQAKLDVKVSPQSTQELGRAAPRPPYSTLGLTKLEKFLNIEALDWKASVANHLSARKGGN